MPWRTLRKLSNQSIYRDDYDPLCMQFEQRGWMDGMSGGVGKKMGTIIFRSSLIDAKEKANIRRWILLPRSFLNRLLISVLGFFLSPLTST